jgi:hypothetical protein
LQKRHHDDLGKVDLSLGFVENCSMASGQSDRPGFDTSVAHQVNHSAAGASRIDQDGVDVFRHLNRPWSGDDLPRIQIRRNPVVQGSPGDRQVALRVLERSLPEVGFGVLELSIDNGPVFSAFHGAGMLDCGLTRLSQRHACHRP